jgi:hypothetical protein
MAYIPKDTVKEHRTQEVYFKEDDTTIRYTYKYNRMIKSEIFYGRGYKSPQQELDERNKGLPKTKRKYLTDEGKIVGYLTAKKKGLV